ncbi:MAG: ubiquinone/menaquinone biosynthesis methyltransferase [Nitrospinota bacterium]
MSPLDPRAEAVRAMFSAIVPRYDLLNRLLSLGMDQRWRRRAVEELLRARRAGDRGGRYLDVGVGTGDVAFAIGEQVGRDEGVRLAGADFSQKMLERAAVKARGRGVGLFLIQADALELPFRTGAFDGAIIAFGLRNLTDPEAGLREMARVVRPGGEVVVLEFGPVRGRLFGLIYRFYFRQVYPRVGRLISGHPTAYDYLPETVSDWPPPEEVSGMMARAGLHHVRHYPLTRGIVYVHAGMR